MEFVINIFHKCYKMTKVQKPNSVLIGAEWKYSEVKLQMFSLNTIITHIDISIICRSKTINWYRVFIHFAHYWNNYWTTR